MTCFAASITSLTPFTCLDVEALRLNKRPAPKTSAWTTAQTLFERGFSPIVAHTLSTCVYLAGHATMTDTAALSTTLSVCVTSPI